VWSSAVEPAIAETNSRLEQMFRNQAGVQCVDIFSELSRGQSKKEHAGLYRDTLHLKPETYVQLSTLLATTLQTWTKEAGTVVPKAP
jgi:hypothetical protein